MRQAYFEYLCSLIDIPTRKYTRLFDALYKKPFKWSVPNDDNRVADAVEIREEYFRECVGVNEVEAADDLRDMEPTMLELIIALSYRCETLAITAEKPMNEWFWTLISNVSLYEYWDDNYEKLGGDAEVNRILDVVIYRTYARNGRGGFFPLTPTSKNKKTDQRKIELWYQMCAYLVENFYSESVTV